MMRALSAVLWLVLLGGCGRPGGSSATSSSTPATPAASVVNNRALLSWSAASGTPDGYYLEQSTDNASWTVVQTLTETGTYVDGLSAGTVYYFRIASYNSAGTSAYSSSTTVKL